MKLIRSLLRLPLFYKIMYANVAIVVAVAVLAHNGALDFGFAGGVAVVLINALILRLALSPLEELEEAAVKVEAGDRTVQVKPSPLADRALLRLIATFNSMVTSVANARRGQLKAAEDERKRIATDLHDKTAQTLAGLLVRLSLLKNVNDDETRAAVIKEAADEASFAMDEVYRVVQALRPPALEMLGLRGAVESHARSVSIETGIQIDVDADDLLGALDEQAEIAVYRIFQEALSNVVRHADAQRAIVRMRRTADGVVVTITDDGIGFDAGATHGLGLYGMQERATYLGGNVAIHSNTHGTTVEVQIPVSQDL
jgi:two-component system sensor histidine kinase UhpB